MERNFISLDRGNRLKSERKRMGLTQKAAAEVVDMKEQSWVRFEKRGEPFDLRVIQALEEIGFDMMFVVFGIKKDDSLETVKPEHFEILRLFNQADENKQAKIIQMIRLMVEEV
ncbi:hypothetical protein CS557_12695 [Acinetobacter junii]|uniref:helix-turn-helix domain-containing protein n=1 Tax=Acinetobacter junii TaxID=40215 RepID=UPI000C1B0589|nr:helix-turn-helix transcriptional regulator [Acinetobacter junii]ATU46292.1 hypothetical protein CS557_12695 [Acinetobacter junii]